jgi:thymidylate synthase ThyX
MSLEKPARVLTIAPMPPERCAYALARYSRSPDSIRESMEWVRTHDSQKFLESFYFQYGHASIADLGHVVMCFEGISELAAIEVEDEVLWDGQARSSRYQDFARSGFQAPAELNAQDGAAYQQAAARLLAAYLEVHEKVGGWLQERLPKPDEMKGEAYQRNIAARAFDVARYLLFLGVGTGVGQVTSIRTLEKQIRRLKCSPYLELRDLGDEIARACAEQPACGWHPGVKEEPLAPTLARHTDPDEHLFCANSDLQMWARHNLPHESALAVEDVDLVKPSHTAADIVATLLYPVCTLPFRELYEMACGWSEQRRQEVLDVALRSRKRRDELLRGFRGGLYAFDIVMDIGAYRDLHRHRRCQQFRQEYTTELGFAVPQAIEEAGMRQMYDAAIAEAQSAAAGLPFPASHYLMPFAQRGRFLFKMDFAEAEYICRLRSGVKGHFSYREVAWKMKRKMDEVEPELSRYIEATPPWIEDPLKR